MNSGSSLLVALFGPTSSGKTALSVELGRQLRRQIEPVVVSADSRQVYRHLDIGTSKTTPEEMRGIRHEMLSVADPDRKYELESYVAAARGHIEQAWQRGQLPMIVGGTAVYVKALLEGWNVQDSARTRNSVRRDFPPDMAEDAYETLKRLDRKAAGRVHPNNYEAVINALSRIMSTPDGGSKQTARTVVLGLDRPASELDARVASTFDRQLRDGLFDEVLGLGERYDLDAEMRRRGKRSGNQVLHTHGYREFWEVALERGKPVRSLTPGDIAEVRAGVVEHIQGYTRRQRAAFRKLPELRMVRTVERAVQYVTAEFK
ncbi:MAG TPA: tRNA (adenosine(37)-N6)-dimethylallyltransferase MiaA [Mycobacteriales bacterium]|nr:tRNA (adenosine(37)-N6)-dimethylallyltransferase MiaA [Mycobacteriales bacterium]